jgi:hypothetical protein
MYRTTGRLGVRIMFMVFSATFNYISVDRSYFVKKHSDSTKKFSETDIINILEFLIDNIFLMFGERVFQQTYGYKLCSSSRRLVEQNICSIFLC